MFLLSNGNEFAPSKGCEFTPNDGIRSKNSTKNILYVLLFPFKARWLCVQSDRILHFIDEAFLENDSGYNDKPMGKMQNQKSKKILQKFANHWH